MKLRRASKSMYFISGVSGVGKTAVMPHLKSLLPADFEVHDFDEGGVPAGADHFWRIKRTHDWINLGLKKSVEGAHVVVCGIANPEEIKFMTQDLSDLKIEIILLDAEVEIIEKRLRERNKDNEVRADLERVVGSVEDFIRNNSQFAGVLREICRKHGCPIIDMTDLGPREVASKVVERISLFAK